MTSPLDALPMKASDPCKSQPLYPQLIFASSLETIFLWQMQLCVPGDTYVVGAPKVLGLRMPIKKCCPKWHLNTHTPKNKTGCGATCRITFHHNSS